MAKKITAKDLALFVGLLCEYNIGESKCIGKIEGVNIKDNYVTAAGFRFHPEDVKPILKSLECLSVEDTVHISCDIMGYDKGTVKEQKKWNKNDLNDIKEYGFIQFDTSDSIFMPKIIEYLIKQGFNLELIPHGTYLLDGKDIKWKEKT